MRQKWNAYRKVPRVLDNQLFCINCPSETSFVQLNPSRLRIAMSETGLVLAASWTCSWCL
jgi:hypothetical protein